MGVGIEIAPGIFAREPETGDGPEALEFFNSLVDEDAMLGNNEKNTPESEERWLVDALSKISAGKAVFLFAFDRKGKLKAIAQAELGKGRRSHVATIGLSVSKDNRRRGIGRALLERILFEAKTKLGAKIATLSVFEENLPARALYSGNGFLEEGKRIGHLLYKGKYSNEILMSKSL